MIARTNLSEAPKEQLWRLWKERKSLEARTEIATREIPNLTVLAKMMAGKRAVRYGAVEIDDLVSVGIAEVMQAADGFEPERGNKFSTYYRRQVRGAMGRLVGTFEPQLTLDPDLL